MNSRRAFLWSLPLMTVGAAAAQTTDHRTRDGVDSAKTLEELKDSLLFSAEWKEAKFRNSKFLFVLTIFGAGQPLIDVHGWEYNSSLKAWSRILIIHTQLVGNAALRDDEKNGVVSLHAVGNNEFLDAEVSRFDLRAVSGG